VARHLDRQDCGPDELVVEDSSVRNSDFFDGKLSFAKVYGWTKGGGFYDLGFSLRGPTQSTLCCALVSRNIGRLLVSDHRVHSILWHWRKTWSFFPGSFQVLLPIQVTGWWSSSQFEIIVVLRRFIFCRLQMWMTPHLQSSVDEFDSIRFRSLFHLQISKGKKIDQTVLPNELSPSEKQKFNCKVALARWFDHSPTDARDERLMMMMTRVGRMYGLREGGVKRWVGPWRFRLDPSTNRWNRSVSSLPATNVHVTSFRCNCFFLCVFKQFWCVPKCIVSHRFLPPSFEWQRMRHQRLVPPSHPRCICTIPTILPKLFHLLL